MRSKGNRRSERVFGQRIVDRNVVGPRHDRLVLLFRFLVVLVWLVWRHVHGPQPEGRLVSWQRCNTANPHYKTNQSPRHQSLSPTPTLLFSNLSLSHNSLRFASTRVQQSFLSGSIFCTLYSLLSLPLFMVVVVLSLLPLDFVLHPNSLGLFSCTFISLSRVEANRPTRQKTKTK